MSNTPASIQPEIINRLRLGVPFGYALLAGMQLDVFSALKDGPRTAVQLAVSLAADAVRLRALLYVLVAAGLLSVDDEHFANGREADQFLVQGRPAYMGFTHRATSIIWDASRTTAESVRTGTAKSKIDWDAMPLEQLESILRSLHAGAMLDGRELVARFDFSGAHAAADIGGGSGGLALGLIEARPQMHATVIDLPRITPITQRIIAEAGAAERVDVLTADVVREPLPGLYDAVILRNVLQVLSPDDARHAVLSAGKATRPGGAMYVIGSILDNSRLAPIGEVAINLFFLNVYDHGQAYTEQEYRDWLAEAGFSAIQRAPWPRGASIISARKQA